MNKFGIVAAGAAIALAAGAVLTLGLLVAWSAAALLALVLWVFVSAGSGRRHHWPWFAAGLLLFACLRRCHGRAA